MPVNVIIIAAIALIVLVVLFAIFTGKMGEWFGATKSCINMGGKCKPSCGTGEKEITGTDCSGDKCCIPIST